MSFTIVVPVDFTEVSNKAIRHAYYISNKNEGKVILMHIAENESAKNAGQAKFESLLNELKLTYDVSNFETLCIVGDLFEDMAKESEKLEARLIVMGTHGKRGMQFITGSRARKLIQSSNVPFLVVQKDDHTDCNYKNIVLPLDLNKDTKQTLQYALKLTEMYGSTIHVLTFTAKDEYYQNRLNRNLTYTKDFLELNKQNFEVHFTDGGAGKFYNGVINYSKKIDADLILILDREDDGYMDDVFGSSHIQNMITNEAHIPVAIYHSKEVMVAAGVDGMMSLLG